MGYLNAIYLMGIDSVSADYEKTYMYSYLKVLNEKDVDPSISIQDRLKGSMFTFSEKKMHENNIDVAAAKERAIVNALKRHEEQKAFLYQRR